MGSRPDAGVGHYLRDLVYGASDGVVTTLAVIAGVVGAQLPSHVAFVLGLANLLGDGFSMGASNYLALKSELEQSGASVRQERPARHGGATFAAFVVVGGIPLVAFLAPFDQRIEFALVLSAMALSLAGAARARFVSRPAWKCALEMLAIGAIASGVAFGVGWAARRLVPWQAM
jgi:VIT1/CCC1 family predicted Fe2+/Mn2+ transporter